MVDGDDGRTPAAIAAAIADERVRLEVGSEPRGAGWARNRGVALARSPWVALLDDDDEWLPGKLEAQLLTASEAAAPWPIVMCRVIARSPDHDAIWPRRLPRGSESLAEYLYVRRGPLAGETAVQTSAILAPRAAFAAVPFDVGLRRHQDHDWLIRILGRPEARIVFDPGVFVVWYRDADRRRTSDLVDWQYSAAWARSRRRYFTPTAYAAFLLVHAGDSAARAGDIRGGLSLIREAASHGHIRVRDVALLGGKFLVPSRVRQRIRRAATGRTRS